ncbi:MAG TPA: energy transducer TonB [Bacteroidales bacterium]|nr:energy transducer TonB [Bacteroidales bacterium]
MKTRSCSAKSLSTIFVVLFCFAFSGTGLFAQAQEEVLVVADEMPVYPGGQMALLKFVYANITYPADAKENGIEGKVIVRFIINKEGKAVQPSISKGLYPSIDEEVIKVISKIPKFEPGKMAGKPVNVWYALPVTFKLVN